MKRKLALLLAVVMTAASPFSATATAAADNAAQTANLLRSLNPTPVPAYVVPNPTCGCGYNTCGGNGFYN